MGTEKEQMPTKRRYLTCEREYIYLLLMITAGMMGAYTYNLRGGVFCNAQTANVVLMALELGKGHWLGGIYYLIPICAYMAGGFVSELLPTPIKRQGVFRWETCLVGIEIIFLFVIGWIPLTVTPRVAQVMINFIASMQYNTFRQTEGMPVATTFCTNHCRLVGLGLADYLRKRDKEALRRSGFSLLMLCVFLASGVLLTFLCPMFQEKIIWMALIPLIITFIFLAHADLTFEHDRLMEKPAGH